MLSSIKVTSDFTLESFNDRISEGTFECTSEGKIIAKAAPGSGLAAAAIYTGDRYRLPDVVELYYVSKDLHLTLFMEGTWKGREIRPLFINFSNAPLLHAESQISVLRTNRMGFTPIFVQLPDNNIVEISAGEYEHDS